MSNQNPYVVNFRALLALSNSSVCKFAEEIGRHQSSVQNVLSGVRRSRFIEKQISERLGVSRELAFPDTLKLASSSKGRIEAIWTCRGLMPLL